MRIEVVDPYRQGLGLAIGLVELGHDVRYVVGPCEGGFTGSLAQMQTDLVEHVLGGVTSEASGDADLGVLVGVFADVLHELGTGFEVSRASGSHWAEGPRAYPNVLRRFVDLAARYPRTVVADMSDRSAPREVLFETLSNVVCLAREHDGDDAATWRPLPFLHSTLMLWLERCVPERDWLFPAGRARQWDWVFCGTLDHPRYEGRRRTAIEQVAARWPMLSGAVFGDIDVERVLAVLQAARCGLDLPGAGRLCFRMHECLLLGIPVWRPFESLDGLPEPLRDVVCTDPTIASRIDRELVRDTYRVHYSPVASARALLASADRSSLPAQRGQA